MQVERLNWSHLNFEGLTHEIRQAACAWLRNEGYLVPYYFGLEKSNVILLSPENADALIKYLKLTWSFQVRHLIHTRSD